MSKPNAETRCSPARNVELEVTVANHLRALDLRLGDQEHRLGVALAERLEAGRIAGRRQRVPARTIRHVDRSWRQPRRAALKRNALDVELRAKRVQAIGA